MKLLSNILCLHFVLGPFQMHMCCSILEMVIKLRLHDFVIRALRLLSNLLVLCDLQHALTSRCCGPLKLQVACFLIMFGYVRSMGAHVFQASWQSLCCVDELAQPLFCWEERISRCVCVCVDLVAFVASWIQFCPPRGAFVLTMFCAPWMRMIISNSHVLRHWWQKPTMDWVCPELCLRCVNWAANLSYCVRNVPKIMKLHCHKCFWRMFWARWQTQSKNKHRQYFAHTWNEPFVKVATTSPSRIHFLCQLHTKFWQRWHWRIRSSKPLYKRLKHVQLFCCPQSKPWSHVLANILLELIEGVKNPTDDTIRQQVQQNEWHDWQSKQNHSICTIVTTCKTCESLTKPHSPRSHSAKTPSSHASPIRGNKTHTCVDTLYDWTHKQCSNNSTI